MAIRQATRNNGSALGGGAGNWTGSRRPIFVDVGANVGWFTISIAASAAALVPALSNSSSSSPASGKGTLQGGRYRVVAIEAMPSNLQLLRASLCANGFTSVALNLEATTAAAAAATLTAAVVPPAAASMLRQQPRVTLHAAAVGATKALCFLKSTSGNRGNGAIASCVGANANLTKAAEDAAEADAIKSIKATTSSFGSSHYQGRMRLERLDDLLGAEDRFMVRVGSRGIHDEGLIGSSGIHGEGLVGFRGIMV